RRVLDGLGEAGSEYRWKIYKDSFSGEKKTVSLADLKHFVEISLQYLEHSIEANRRNDNLYHAYNLVTIEGEKEASISYLSEMLEGQVAVLSAGYLSSKEAVAVLDGLKNSALFRNDQYSYILYPNKDLPGFIAKNTISETSVLQSELLQTLVAEGNVQIVEKDINGEHHFNGSFKNADDLRLALEQLAESSHADLVEKDKALVLQIFEEVFNHKAFTGRSGTFFGYEGLGSIYWHMVSKLQLAVQECCLKAIEEKESAEVVGKLLEHYYEINEGIGVHKSPELYGAFPTDPYSHTPAGRGAQQPGMTGQVKEDVLSRFGELGVFIRDGKLCFNPCLLRKEEFLTEGKTFEYVDIDSAHKQLKVKAGAICFTYCQVPIVYQMAASNGLELVHQDSTITKFESLSLDAAKSKQVFERTGEVTQIIVQVKETDLR
ncbi:MAG: hypothetical protein AB8B69_22590, partial [Chitinophagales bacterium]